MKRKAVVVSIIVLLLSLAVLTTGCWFSNGDDQDNTTEVEDETREYRIFYNDGETTQTINVTKGSLYYIPSIPEKEGYTFDGLYDAEVGGTKYVAANGCSLSMFTDSRDVMLFPRFVPNKYIIELDYQGAEVSAEREIVVYYDEEITYLPQVYYQNKVFKGWFTQPGCEGKMVADQNGVLPSMAVFNSENYDLESGSNRVKLYAGFDLSLVEVTFFCGNEFRTEKIQYGTKISEISVKFRSGGLQVSAWSLSQVNPESHIFEGEITESIMLYAAKFSPYIDFDPNGGTLENATLVADAGSNISLPVPQKSGSIFVCWKDENGVKYTSKTMPDTSKKLTAMWSASASLNRNSSHNITDSGRKNQYKDVINFSQLFGLSLEQLKAQGYTNVRFSFSLLVSEIDDGFQWWFLSRSAEGTDNIKESSFEHGSGDTVGSSWWHDFTVETTLSSCRETLYLMYGAEGWFGDTWRNEMLKMTITVY